MADTTTITSNVIDGSTISVDVTEGTTVTSSVVAGGKGDTGDTGATGAAGADGSDGADGASINWRGDYATSTNYATLDMVHYTDGASYVCVGDHNSGDGSNFGTYFEIAAEKGETGDTGPAGQDTLNRIGGITSSATPTPDIDSYDQYNITALAEAAAFAAPSGTPVDGQRLRIRILDDGTGRALTWNSIYREMSVTLPTTTTANKTIYIGCIYNDADTKWDVIAVAQEV